MLMIFMRPKASVNPLERRNNNDPKATPLSRCRPQYVICVEPLLSSTIGLKVQRFGTVRWQNSQFQKAGRSCTVLHLSGLVPSSDGSTPLEKSE